MIRFGAIVSVVAVAIGLLIAGAIAGELALVYVSVGLAALALVMLIVGVAVWRDDVFGSPARAPAESADRAVSPANGADEAVRAGRKQAPQPVTEDEREPSAAALSRSGRIRRRRISAGRIPTCRSSRCRGPMRPRMISDVL